MRLLAMAGLLLGLVACTHTTDGSPTPTSTSTDKLGLPPVAYDAAIYFCTPVNADNRDCHGPASTAEKAALRARLLADPATAQIKLLTEQNAYTLAKDALPASTYKDLRPGDLPAYYVVALAEPASTTSFLTGYQHVPGVAAVAPCRVACSVVALRAAGIVH